MKKLLYVFLALTMAFAVVACSKPTDSTPEYWDITFDANGYEGEDFDDLPEVVKVVKGSAYTLPALDGTDADQEFLGWATSTTGTPLAGLTYTPTADTVLYVKWVALVADGTPITIEYEQNGWTGDVPADYTTATAGSAITAAAIPDLPDTKTQSFLGWATFASATSADIIDANYTTNYATLTLYVVWEPRPVWLITIDVNGGVYTGDADDLEIAVDQGDDFDFGLLTAIGSDLTAPVLTTFEGWYRGETKLTTDFTPSKNETIRANWTDNSPAHATYVETFATNNDSYAIFRFILPPGYTLDDYQSLAFDVALVYPELNNDIQIRSFRLMGPYSFAPEGKDAQGTPNLEFGDFWKKRVEGDQIVHFDGSAYVAEYGNNGKNGNWIAGQKANSSYTTNYGQFGWQADDEGDESHDFFAVQWALNGDDGRGGGSTSAGGNWHPESTGPLYFGIGISGNQTAIVQKLKNIRMIGYQGVPTVYSTTGGFDEPAFTGYVTSGPFSSYSWVGNAWRDGGDAVNNPAPIYVKFDNNYTDAPAGPIDMVFPGEKYADLFDNISSASPGAKPIPSASRLGYIFKEWNTAADGTGTKIDANYVFNTKTVAYAQWDVDPTYVQDPDWDELTKFYDLGAIGWDNGANQKGWGTKQWYGTDGQEKTSALDLADLRNAKYLVIELENLPEGGVSLNWQGGVNRGNNWSAQQVSAADGGENDTFGFQIDEENNLMIFQLSKGFPDYALLTTGDDTWVRFYVQYYGPDSTNWDAIGFVSAKLLFLDDYTIVSE